MDYAKVLKDLEKRLDKLERLKRANDQCDIEDKLAAVGTFLYVELDDVCGSVSDAVDALDELIEKLESLEAQYEELEQKYDSLENSIIEANEY